MPEHGAILIGGKQTASTIMCAHCGLHFEMVPGSGKKRGWCGKCNSMTCGAEQCNRCVPIEARLDFAEGTKSSHTETIKQLIAEGALIL